MTFKNTLLATALIAAAALSAPAAMADPFDITNTGNWTAINGGVNINGLNTPSIKWGTPNNPQNLQSGYDWTPLPVTGITDLTDTSGFVIGRFTHNNFTIGGGGAPSTVTLTLDVTVTDQLGPTDLATPQFTFVFNHNETDNLIGSPPGTICPDTGIPVPAVGCPDIVSLPSAFAPQLVDLGAAGIKTMQILGFLLDDGDGVYEPLTDTTLVSEFITTEAAANHAYLLVTFSDPPPQAPEPASIGLLGLGILGLSWMGYRRRKSA